MVAFLFLAAGGLIISFLVVEDKIQSNKVEIKSLKKE